MINEIIDINVFFLNISKYYQSLALVSISIQKGGFACNLYFSIN